MVCAIYCRVSTEDQRDNYSIKLQEERGKKFAEAQGWDAAVYKDVQSGSSIKRTAFTQLIKDIEDEKIGAVHVVEFSRLSRNDEEDAIFIRRLFIEKGVELYENGTAITFNSPEDQLFYNIRSSVAAYERRKIRQRMEAGLNEKYSKGEKVNPRIFGYDYNDGTITVNEDEAETIRYIFQSVVDGRSYSEIAEDLIVRGKKRKLGGTNWTSGAITKLLRQPTYHGYILHNGKLIKSKMYPAIIDDDLWKKSRAKLKDKMKYKHKLDMRRGQFELSGILTCGSCGAKYFRKSNLKRGFYQHSAPNQNALECRRENGKKTITELKILYLVRALYLENFEDYKNVSGFYQEELAKIESENEDIKSQLQEMESTRESLNRGLQRLVEAVTAGALSLDDVRVKREQIEAQIAAIEQRQKDLTLVMNSKKDYLSTLDDFSQDEVMEFWDLSQSERKALYGVRINKLHLIDHTLTIEFINRRTIVIPHIYKLTEYWQNRVDIVESYYQEEYNGVQT